MREFTKNVLGLESTIEDVINLIDSADNKICFIVNEHRQLVGSITDGDLRRAFVKGFNLKDHAKVIMNQSPKFISSSESRQDALAKMKKLTLKFLPVLDSDKRIVRIECFEDIVGLTPRENRVVLMAGGFGKRLSPLTDDTPKPLLNVGGRPILETIIKSFSNYGFSNFILSVNYKSEMIKDYFGDGSKMGVNIQYLDETVPLGTCGSLSMVGNELKEPFFVMNGDILTNINFAQLLDYHIDHSAVATMCVREHSLQVPYGVVNLKDKGIGSIDEKPIQKFFVNAGIYVLSPDVLKYIPENEYFDMPSLFNKLIEEQKATAAFPIREYWMDIGKMDDFHRAQYDFETVFKS